jgi:hypothetical protein
MLLQMRGRASPFVLALAALLAVPAVTGAEIVFFTSGRTMSVKAHRPDGENVVLKLRDGGELACPASLIDRIAPDEVPLPDEDEVGDAIDVPAEYRTFIDRTAAEHGVSARLVRAVIQVESAFRARARSPKGAIGLMQLMPETARRFAVADPYDPRANIEGGIKYLKSLLDRFDTVALALAAYNAGESAVERFGGMPPYAETRSYVEAVLRLAGPGQ